MKNIIFLAPPAGGKGTFSSMICSEYNIPHISTGDLLRAASTDGSELGNYIKSQIEQGLFVSDDIIYELLTSRLSKSDCKNGYILDGFPRNVEQAIKYNEILEKLNIDLGVVILLNVPKDVCLSRIVGRLTCPKCNKIYNTNNKDMKPIKEGICDICNVELNKRSDDNADTYETRYNTYIEKTQPLVDFYKKLNVLYEITETEKDKTYSKVLEILRGFSND